MTTQQVTPAKSRSSDGCWTCRLRRKKCDEIRPVCVACSALEIECLYSDNKPEWMDGAEKQKEKAEWLKLEVKRLAAARRERRHMESLEMGMDGLEVANPVDTSAVGTVSAATAAGSSSTASNTNGTPHDSGSESWMLDPGVQSQASSTTPSSMGQASAATPSTFLGMQVPVHRVGLDDRDLTFMMMYLDYTFPFLYPFYRPHILDGGRGWLLVIMMRNKALFHIALSLSAYIFSEIMKRECDTHTQCLQHNWDSLQEQQQLAMQELQSDMRELNQKGVQGYLAASGQVMGSVMQLLSFEVAIANTGNWQMHLDAASVLLEQIVEHHGTSDAGNLCWHRLLHQLGGGVVPYTLADEGHRPWSPDQASLRFFTASLLFFDTLSATALGRAPRLIKYHPHLLNVLDHCCDDHPVHPSIPHLEMQDFFGVPNWVVQSVAATAALAAWKRDQKAANSLSITQLVSRAGCIERTLKAHIADLDAKLTSPPQPAAMNPYILLGQAVSASTGTPAMTPLATPPLSSSYSDSPLRGDQVTARIWAQAAITYLLVVVSGWQPSNPEIRESVALTMRLLRQLPAAAGLRSVVWPFAVTGCLAAPEEEQGFKDMVTALGPLQIFGTVREALGIMEEVWAHRECIGALPDNWDVAVGLNNLGHPSLLI